MCGYLGVFDPSLNTLSEIMLERLGAKINHRGPDMLGTYVNQSVGISIVHQRLSILDTSSTARQPFLSNNENLVIAFNGEIYNHQELRELLPSHKWKSTSDTETLIENIAHFGLNETLSRIHGMFSFAVLDLKSQTISLVRDRMGEKPLYYGWNSGKFYFGSDIRGFLTNPEFDAELESGVIPHFLAYGYTPSDRSILKNIYKLQPGNSLTLSLDTCKSTSNEYWSILDVATSATQIKGRVSMADLHTSLRRAVKSQMLADVPVGAFLSGGIDSSLITALMQEQSTERVKTFSIGFENNEFNETHYADKVAKHLGTEHTEAIMTANNAIAYFNDLPKYFSEPFGDSSQLPTMFVSDIASQKVKVALSGDGGDELFLGYNRYQWLHKIDNTKAKIPNIFIPFINVLSEATKSNLVSYSINSLNKLILGKKRVHNLSDKMNKLFRILGENSLTNQYSILVQNRVHSDLLNFSFDEETFDEENILSIEAPLTKIEKIAYIDQKTYLPEDILQKVDRSSMAASLETRVPFLDENVVALSWQFAQNQKMNGGLGKIPLRNILEKYIPENIINRPKMGFGIPLFDWLRNVFNKEIEELLSMQSIISVGIFDYSEVSAMWKDIKHGKVADIYLFWNIIILQQWCLHYKVFRHK